MLAQALHDRQAAPRCSVCGHDEPRCGDEAVAVACWRCTSNAVAGTPAPVADGKACADCGKTAPGIARLCRPCAAKRSRANRRKWWAAKKQRQNVRH